MFRIAHYFPPISFQLTPSRRATISGDPRHHRRRFQLTPSRRATIFAHTSRNLSTFQLTPSRRATLRCSLEVSRIRHFNSRPHGGRRLFYLGYLPRSHFNSRPHGGRPLYISGPSFPLIFQLTPSRRATLRKDVLHLTQHFNSRPHGGRPRKVGFWHGIADFNSRPHGGRLFRIAHYFPPISFQLTPSRRATISSINGLGDKAFQLTPSRRATPQPRDYRLQILHFNSRPHGGRQQI